MAPSISKREYIRWLPDKPGEPTSTIVVTSAQNRFVDIRILKAVADVAPGKIPNYLLPLKCSQ